MNYDDITAEDGYTILFDLGDFEAEVTPRRHDERWVEGKVISGEAPYNWGGKTYQGYLTPYDIQNWLQNDFDYCRILDVYRY